MGSAQVTTCARCRGAGAVGSKHTHLSRASFLTEGKQLRTHLFLQEMFIEVLLRATCWPGRQEQGSEREPTLQWSCQRSAPTTDPGECARGRRQMPGPGGGRAHLDTQPHPAGPSHQNDSSVAVLHSQSLLPLTIHRDQAPSHLTLTPGFRAQLYCAQLFPMASVLLSEGKKIPCS